MRNLRVIMPAFLLGIISFQVGGCFGGKTSLSVSITSNPQGGRRVSALYCSFRGQLSRGGVFSCSPSPIAVTVEWWWENYYHHNQTLMQSEHYTFTSETPVTYTAEYSKPGSYLLNYYWVKIKWTDEDGTSHIEESSKSYSYTSMMDREAYGDKEVVKFIP